ncbi:Tim44 domain-containing protein [Undibacterium flavidum]|uniref:TIM44-like domain-containing protein n=1 Tax=Undibacterium flavidum TaxID=2762297 RepID=A0ABR6YBB8_9BURK|nr:TIM44-like domain-containing protein [Undibacterium flavidum]MBC3873846.1 TIM44-like domain-containing protein [Undibacterium flavidum]
MNKIFLSLMLMLGAMTMVVADADAQRMGKRSSFGRQSSNVTQKAPPATTANPAQAAKPGAPNAATPAVPPKPSIPWKGIVGGLIGGALLAGLFSSLGMGGGLASAMGSILTFALIGFAVFFLFRLFTRKKDGAAPSMFNQQPAYAGVPNNNSLPEIGSRINPAQQAPAAFTPASVSTANLNSTGSAPVANQGTWTVPADFDVAAFLRSAKSNYIRLQAAWDRGDINDIREFTSPEMFAEMKLELQDRGNAKNETDVVSLEAEFLGLETQTYDYLASVKFTGMIKEGGATMAEPFAEVWNLAKPVNGQSGWLLAGIQQLN